MRGGFLSKRKTASWKRCGKKIGAAPAKWTRIGKNQQRRYLPVSKRRKVESDEQ
jgi:hypothetical protein